MSLRAVVVPGSKVTLPTSHLQGLPATVGQRAKGVPLVADLLAPGIDIVRVIVIQLTVGWAERGESWQEAINGTPGPTCPQVSQALVPGHQRRKLSVIHQPLGPMSPWIGGIQGVRLGEGVNRENRGSLLLPYFMSCSATNKLTLGGTQIVAPNQTCIWTGFPCKESLAEYVGWSMGTGAQVPRSELWLHSFVCVWPWGRERPTGHACFLSVKQWWVIVDSKSLSGCTVLRAVLHTE